MIRTLSHIYDVLAERQKNEDIEIHVSYLEIYQDIGYDLLNSASRASVVVQSFPKVSYSTVSVFFLLKFVNLSIIISIAAAKIFYQSISLRDPDTNLFLFDLIIVSDESDRNFLQCIPKGWKFFYHFQG